MKTTLPVIITSSKTKLSPSGNSRFLLFRGPSLIDGKTIRVILTPRSANRKTGDIPQVWILVDDMAPTEIISRGLDETICGGCEFRSTASGGNGDCYVGILHGPQSVWKAREYVDCTKLPGKKPNRAWRDLEKAIGGRVVRLGAYGEPTAFPLDVNLAIRNIAPTLGYTHRWDEIDVNEWGFLMASADNFNHALGAWAAGWRTFRVLWANREIVDALPIRGIEVPCPAVSGITCDECKLCCGLDRLGKRSITIPAHGKGIKRVESDFSRFAGSVYAQDYLERYVNYYRSSPSDFQIVDNAIGDVQSAMRAHAGM